jgi:translation initiation factor 1 (eIF-1/SUI1)
MVDISSIQKKDINAIFTDIDKIVTIRWLKEKKTSRTYVSGLQDFISDEEIKKIVKTLKEKLGTGASEFKNEGKSDYGFQGDHREKVKKFLVENVGIPEKKIKVQ